MIELCVSLYNAQCQELQLKGFDSITYHKLFGMPIRNDNENTNKIDLGNYECICFDEIGLNNFRELTNIARFINDHQDKLIIATGDSDQNTPFTHKLNNYEYNMKEYLITCRNIIFPNQITLHINKRSKTEDDKQKMELLKEDIFNKNLSLIDVFKIHNIKIIDKLTDLKTTKNISYFNFRSNMINKHVQKFLVDKTNIANYFMKNGLMYYNGLIIVCKNITNIKILY